jgi:hypothetical protein
MPPFSLEDELKEAMRLEVAPVIDKIKAEGGGLEGLARIIEEVVIPLIGTNKAAILRLAREVDELRRGIAGEDAGD